MPVEVRPIKPSDRELLEAFHARQSPESIYLRFFQFRPKLPSSELDRLTQVDYVHRMAFVALIGGELVGVARYEKVAGSNRPEVAFFVDDGHQGRGLATLMLEYLAAAARAQGIGGFIASVLPENHAMLGVFKRAGFSVKTWFDDGLIGVDLDIAVTTEMADAVARRLSRARSRSVARLLAPASVAVVGAGRSPGTVGHELLRQLLDGGFVGDVYAVNPAADEVLGQRCYPSLAAIEAPIDLAVVALPPASVEAVVQEAAEVGVAGLLIASAGFSESTAEGAELEQRIVGVARSNAMRLVGPNSFGLVNTDPDVRLHAMFLPIETEPGSVGLISESGPLGAGFLEKLRVGGTGVSSFVSVGNRADVSVNDVLDYWLVDDATRACLLYVENYGNLKNFLSTARSLGASKPIVTLRPADDDLVDLMVQSGVILTGSVGEMAGVAKAACCQPVPEGAKVAVVSNTASVARLAVTACRRAGLQVVVPDEVDPSARNRGRALDAVIVGDVDREPPKGRRLDYEEPLVAAAVSAGVDAVLVAVVPTLGLPPDGLGRLLGRVNRSVDKPIVAAGLVGPDHLTVPGLPIYEFPDEAARALGHLARYGAWRRAAPSPNPLATDEEITATAKAVRPIVVDLLADASPASANDESGPLAPARTFAGPPLDLLAVDATTLIEALGLPVADWRVIEDRSQLQGAADEIGYPVALKAGQVARRTVGETGGVAIDIHDGEDLLAAYDRMVAAAGPDGSPPTILQTMVASSANARITLIQDPAHVAFVQVGIGGAVRSVIKPAGRRFLPLAEGDDVALADILSTSIPMGIHGRAVIARLVRRLAIVGPAVPELARVDLDPVLIAGSETAVGDVTIEVRAVNADPLADVRRL